MSKYLLLGPWIQKDSERLYIFRLYVIFFMEAEPNLAWQVAIYYFYYQLICCFLSVNMNHSFSKHKVL